MIPEALGATGSPGTDDCRTRTDAARKNPRSELSHLGNRVTPRGLSCQSNARRLAADLADPTRRGAWAQRPPDAGDHGAAAAPSAVESGRPVALLAVEQGQQRRDRFGRLRRHRPGRRASPSATTTRSAASPTTRRPPSGSPADRRGPTVAARSAAVERAAPPTARRRRHVGPPLRRPARDRHGDARPRVGRLDRRVRAKCQRARRPRPGWPAGTPGDVREPIASAHRLPRRCAAGRAGPRRPRRDARSAARSSGWTS